MQYTYTILLECYTLNGFPAQKGIVTDELLGSVINPAKI
jgi:hypothetical protein